MKQLKDLKNYESNLTDELLGTNEICEDIGRYKHYVWVVVLNPSLRTYNGYVLINKDQNGYNFEGSFEEHGDIDCHGGITFDSYNKIEDRVIGFDTDHPGDYQPAWRNQIPDIDGEVHYFTMKDIINEDKHIIDQLVKKDY